MTNYALPIMPDSFICPRGVSYVLLVHNMSRRRLLPCTNAFVPKKIILNKDYNNPDLNLSRFRVYFYTFNHRFVVM